MVWGVAKTVATSLSNTTRRLSATAHWLVGTKKHYDDIMIDAGQILIAMIAVLMMRIGSCATTAELATIFNHVAASFNVAVDRYIDIASATYIEEDLYPEKTPLYTFRKFVYTRNKSNDIAFVRRYKKKLLDEIRSKFEKHFTRVVPGPATTDLWEKWTNPDTSPQMISEFFGSVFLCYYLTDIINAERRIKNFIDIETIRLCLFDKPIGVIDVNREYYGQPNSGGGHYNEMVNRVRDISQIGAFCMLCRNNEISGVLVGAAERFSSLPSCSSPTFARLCGVFMYLPRVLPLFQIMATVRLPWVSDMDPSVVTRYYEIIKTLESIIDTSHEIVDYPLEACVLCFDHEIQRRSFNSSRTAGLILGNFCKNLCPNTRLLGTSCAYSCYRTALQQHAEAALENRGYELPEDQTSEQLRCPWCSMFSFGADVVPFIVDATAENGIKLHPVIDDLTRVMGGAPREHEVKPSLKSQLETIRHASNIGFYYDTRPRSNRWILLTTINDDPVLARFIPKFVVIQKGDLDCRFHILLDALNQMRRREIDAQDTMREQAARRAREAERAREAAERAAAEREAAERAAARARSRSRGGRLNRRTKKGSHGKNLPKSKSKKSKKYNKTRSNRL